MSYRGFFVPDRESQERRIVQSRLNRGDTNWFRFLFKILLIAIVISGIVFLLKDNTNVKKLMTDGTLSKYTEITADSFYKDLRKDGLIATKEKWVGESIEITGRLATTKIYDNTFQLDPLSAQRQNPPIRCKLFSDLDKIRFQKAEIGIRVIVKGTVDEITKDGIQITVEEVEIKPT